MKGGVVIRIKIFRAVHHMYIVMCERECLILLCYC